MEQNIKTKKRQFAGKTEFVLTPIDTKNAKTITKTTEQREADKKERHFYQRMLRAYLKGKENFSFGRKWVNNSWQPIQYKVLVKWV